MLAVSRLPQFLVPRFLSTRKNALRNTTEHKLKNEESLSLLYYQHSQPQGDWNNTNITLCEKTQKIRRSFLCNSKLKRGKPSVKLDTARCFTVTTEEKEGMLFVANF